MLSLRERMELDLEAKLMGETLVLNRSLDPLYGYYIELNDLNVPLELRRDQVDNLMPTTEEGEIDADDLEEMDLKWQMAMLTVGNYTFLGDELEVADGNADNKSKEISQEDRKESRAPKNQDSRNREITRRNVPVEETTLNVLVSQCDGFGYDWSDQAEEGPTNFALMAYTCSSSSSSDTKSQLNVGAYKACLESVEARLDVYKKNEAVFEEDIKILKFDIQVSDKFKTGVGYDSQVFYSQVVDSQVNDKYKTGEGYHTIPPPYTRNFMPPKSNLVHADKDEYVSSESVTSVPAVATSKVKTSVSKPKSVSEPLIEDWVSDNEDENETEESVKKVENNEQAEYSRKNSQIPRDFDFYEKKMVEKPVWNNARRVNHQNSQRITHPHPKRNVFPRAVLMKFGLKTLNTARENVTTIGPKAVVSDNKGNEANVVKASACWVWRPKHKGNPQLELQKKGVIDSGCSRHMTGNKSYLSDYVEIDGGFVAFGGNSKDGKITGKGKIRTGKLDFEDVYFF
ncbi:hypothetical protein Tco_0394688, partial [Tanacetum coccineum]